MKEMIKKVMKFLKGEDEVVEVRVLDTSERTVSGYYSDYTTIEGVSSRYNSHYNIFFTLNHINDELCTSVSLNRYTQYAKRTTKDSDISFRSYILVDLDPIRPTGVSSTDEEHSLALETAKTIKNDLMEFGFGEPISADSGNGAHLLVAVHVANTVEVTQTVKKFLNVLSDKYSNEKIEVDTSTYNASRICKLYGTVARKGENTTERPHREAKILDDIDTFVIKQTDFSVIEEYVRVNEVKKQSSIKQYPLTASTTNNENIFDIEKWLEKHSIEVLGVKNGEKGKIYVLKECPFDVEHDDSPGAFIFQGNNGVITASCHHDKCQKSGHANFDYIWNKYEPNQPNPNSLLKPNQSNLKIGGESSADKLIGKFLDQGNELFADYLGNEYFKPKNGKVIKIGEKSSKNYLTMMYLKLFSKSITKMALEQVEMNLTSLAANSGKRIVRQRFGFEKDCLYYNLNLESGEVVMVAPNEEGKYVTSISHNISQLEFYTTELNLEVPVPKMTKEDFTLRDFFDKHFSILDEEERIIHDVLIVYRFFSNHQQPLAMYIGNKGSGKTLTSKMVKTLIDPSEETVIAKPKNDSDFKTILGTHESLVIDNASDLTSNESDLLCISVTGGKSSKRKLYTDGELYTDDLQCAVTITTIDIPTSKSDLLDRTLFFHFNKMSSKVRKDELDLMNSFKEDIPDMLYRVFEVICNVMNRMKVEEYNDESIIRNMTFQKVGSFIASELGYSKEAFYQALRINTQNMNEDYLESNDFLSILNMYLSAQHEYIGTATILYRELTEYAKRYNVDLSKEIRNSSILSKKLKQEIDTLNANGITFESKKSNGTRKIILIKDNQPLKGKIKNRKGEKENMKKEIKEMLQEALTKFELKERDGIQDIDLNSETDLSEVLKEKDTFDEVNAFLSNLTEEELLTINTIIRIGEDGLMDGVSKDETFKKYYQELKEEQESKEAEVRRLVGLGDVSTALKEGMKLMGMTD